MQPANIPERFLGVFLTQWQELLRLRRAVLKTSDPDDIHDLRVASRRFRAVLGLFEKLFPSNSAAKLKKKTGKLTKILGSLRNIDEALLFFRPRVPADSSTEYHLFNILAEMRTGELRRIGGALAEFDPRRFDRVVRELASGLRDASTPEGNTRSLPAFFSDVSITLFQPIYNLQAVSSAPEQRESRHALRIAIKKLRYFLEIVAQVLDCDYGQELGLLKEYQSVLGRMNDVAEFGILCRELTLSPSEREFVEAALSVEDELLLNRFIELVGQKPLVYTFRI